MKRLREHQKKFFWIYNNYKYSDPISIETFYETALETSDKVKNIQERLDQIRFYEDIREKERSSILANFNFTKDEERILKWSSILAWWQDQRKKANLIADYWLNEFLKKIGERYNYSLIELQHTDFNEILGLLEGKKISKSVIKTRMKECFHYILPDGSIGLIEGKEATKIKNKLLVTKDETDLWELRGLSGSLGIAHGKVRIIRNPKTESIEKGDILVAGMTRPDYLPLMKKAAAIVTDEGGITCHAAIIARELGIPCVISTKKATSILRDGQEVTVNANHGIVRIPKGE